MPSPHRALTLAVAVALTAGALPAQPFADLSGWTIVAGSGLVTPQSVNLSTSTMSETTCFFEVFNGSSCSAAQSPQFATSGGTLSFAYRFNAEDTSFPSTSAAVVALQELHAGGRLTFPVNLRSVNLVGGTSGILSFQSLLGAGVYRLLAVLERRDGSTGNSSLVITNVALPQAPVVPTPVPEPATLALVGTGLLALGGAARRQHRR